MNRGLAEGAVTPCSCRDVTAACWLVSTGGRGAVHVGWVLLGLVGSVHRMLRGVVCVNRLWGMIDVYRLVRIVGVDRLRRIVGVQRLRWIVGVQRLRWIVGVYRLRRMVDIFWRIITNILRLIVVVLDRVVVVVGGVGRGRTVDRREESRNYQFDEDDISWQDLVSHLVLAGLAESRLYLYTHFFFCWSRKPPTRREPRTPTPIPTTAPSTRVLPVLSTLVVGLAAVFFSSLEEKISSQQHLI